MQLLNRERKEGALAPHPSQLQAKLDEKRQIFAAAAKNVFHPAQHGIIITKSNFWLSQKEE